jgi:hypothetical protein
MQTSCVLTVCSTSAVTLTNSGFNGFGPGPYAHGLFSTRPAAPPAPVVVRTWPTEVALRWRFGGRKEARLRELKRVFEVSVMALPAYVSI